MNMVDLAEIHAEAMVSRLIAEKELADLELRRVNDELRSKEREVARLEEKLRKARCA
jgi:hypothetical protein